MVYVVQKSGRTSSRRTLATVAMHFVRIIMLYGYNSSRHVSLVINLLSIPAYSVFVQDMRLLRSPSRPFPNLSSFISLLWSVSTFSLFYYCNLFVLVVILRYSFNIWSILTDLTFTEFFSSIYIVKEPINNKHSLQF